MPENGRWDLIRRLKVKFGTKMVSFKLALSYPSTLSFLWNFGLYLVRGPLPIFFLGFRNNLGFTK